MNIEGKPYEYTLTYIEGNKEVTHIFPADIDGYELRENLIRFLKACSWDDKQIDIILGGSSNE